MSLIFTSSLSVRFSLAWNHFRCCRVKIISYIKKVQDYSCVPGSLTYACFTELRNVVSFKMEFWKSLELVKKKL